MRRREMRIVAHSSRIATAATSFKTKSPKMYIALKTETFAKLFFLISFTGLVMYAILAFFTFHTAYTTMSDIESYQTNLPTLLKNPQVSSINNEMKYILVWEIPIFNTTDFGEGQEPFVKYNCSYSNCYITTKPYILNEDYRNFDALMMDVGVVRRLRNVFAPRYRHLKQKFVFFGMRSSNETPICSFTADGFFNWTWSYKLSSDIVTPFIEVLDNTGKPVAPKYNVRWLQNFSDLPENIMEKLQTKKKAVAWVMDTCREKVHRMMFVKDLRNALNAHHLDLDVLTHKCGKKVCPGDDCLKVVERDYYYYLAYERSFTEDYVTEEVLNGYDHYAVPIVKGGADYNLFLPDGSYLDAGRSSIKKLAAIIEYSIRNPDVYYNFHRWRSHYIIRRVDFKSGLCGLCENLNNESTFSTYSTYESFRRWWYNGNLADRCYPKGAENMTDIYSYLNSKKKSHHKS